ncbi:hypothetical protein [Microvirga sp. CF3016]|uniref:hypothetical protein n=1 Tax=Microvirga sp. CF3016 TaxID=3110181 RepID=UPI002E7835FA|nr:hypothetical protein [Microvirga sp. CF3016]MEE1610939.1 hypothetical protein [Microvirga sp. CF3016]
MDGSDQLGSVVTLGIGFAAGLMLFLLIAWLIRAIWRWMIGEGRQIDHGRKQEPKFDPVKPISPSGVSASDLFVVRSNLNAVARQIEDLERRLRLEPSRGSREMAASRD